MLPQKMLKMEPLRLAKNAFPAYGYDHEVILNYAGKEEFYRSIVRISHISHHQWKNKSCHQNKNKGLNII